MNQFNFKSFLIDNNSVNWANLNNNKKLLTWIPILHDTTSLAIGEVVGSHLDPNEGHLLASECLYTLVGHKCGSGGPWSWGARAFDEDMGPLPRSKQGSWFSHLVWVRHHGLHPWQARAAAPLPGVDEGAKALSGQEGKENEKRKRKKEIYIYIKKFYKNYKIIK